MSDPVDLEVQLRALVELTTSTIIPAPQAGWSLELQRTTTHLQVREVRDGEVRPWVDVVALEELVGPAGAVPVFAVVDGALAYRFGDSGPWGQLLTIESLRGHDGLSAYQLWMEAGNVGTVLDFLASLKGEAPELPSFVVSSTVGVVGSVPTVVAEEVDGEVRFKFVLPPPRDGVSPPPLSLSVTSSEVAQGQPMTASLSGSYPNLTLALGLRAGTPGTPGGIGPQGASGMPNVDLVGTGMPNGVVTASPGTVYRDTFTSGGLLGTNGASQWIKVSGAGNTGWVVLRGDTGWRRIPLPAAFNQAYGFVNFRRINDEVTFLVSDVWPTQAGEIYIMSGAAAGMAGFRPTGRVASQVWREGVAIASSLLGWKSAGLFYQSAGSNSWTYATLTALTAEAWPTGALIGTPA